MEKSKKRKIYTEIKYNVPIQVYTNQKTKDEKVLQIYHQLSLPLSLKV